jgi:protein-tyrosine phosphatase
METPTHRIVALEGSHNLRDIGGYPATGGATTAWRKVFRSGTMSELEIEGLRQLGELKLRAVCDMRSTSERTRKPSRFPDAYDFELVTREYDSSVADITRTLRQPGLTRDGAHEIVRGFYRDLPYEQAPMYRILFKRLASGQLPLLFHCSAGKDRTGAAAAILLDVLGVPREAIMQDYLLTNDFLERGTELARKDAWSSSFGQVDEEIFKALMSADETYLEALFDQLDSRHGSTSRYLVETLELLPGEIDSLKKHLLD